MTVVAARSPNDSVILRGLAGVVRTRLLQHDRFLVDAIRWLPGRGWLAPRLDLVPGSRCPRWAAGENYALAAPPCALSLSVAADPQPGVAIHDLGSVVTRGEPGRGRRSGRGELSPFAQAVTRCLQIFPKALEPDRPRDHPGPADPGRDRGRHRGRVLSVLLRDRGKDETPRSRSRSAMPTTSASSASIAVTATPPSRTPASRTSPRPRRA